jgi:XcyI restriction endonuclease
LSAVDPGTVHELQLLTLGPQLRGSANVNVGQAAVKVVFDLLNTFFHRYSPAVKGRTMIIKNDSDLLVRIHFGGDPM